MNIKNQILNLFNNVCTKQLRISKHLFARIYKYKYLLTASVYVRTIYLYYNNISVVTFSSTFTLSSGFIYVHPLRVNTVYRFNRSFIICRCKFKGRHSKDFEVYTVDVLLIVQIVFVWKTIGTIFTNKFPLIYHLSHLIAGYGGRTQRIYLKNYYQLHAVSRTQQGRQRRRRYSVPHFLTNSGGIAC